MLCDTEYWTCNLNYGFKHLTVVNDNIIEFTSDLIPKMDDFVSTCFYLAMVMKKDGDIDQLVRVSIGKLKRILISQSIYLINPVWLNDDFILDFIQSLFNKHCMFNK